MFCGAVSRPTSLLASNGALSPTIILITSGDHLEEKFLSSYYFRLSVCLYNYVLQKFIGVPAEHIMLEGGLVISFAFLTGLLRRWNEQNTDYPPSNYRPPFQMQFLYQNELFLSFSGPRSIFRVRNFGEIQRPFTVSAEIRQETHTQRGLEVKTAIPNYGCWFRRLRVVARCDQTVHSVLPYSPWTVQSCACAGHSSGCWG